MINFLYKFWSMYDNAKEPWRCIWAMSILWPFVIVFYCEDIPLIFRLPIAGFFGLVLFSKMIYTIVKESDSMRRRKINKVWKEIKAEKGLNLQCDLSFVYNEAIKVPNDGIFVDHRNGIKLPLEIYHERERSE